MNDLLTPLAIVGIVVFGIAVVLVAFLLVREALAFVRLVRGSRVSVRITWGDKPIAPTPPWLEADDPPLLEGPERPRDSGNGTGVRKGWGFD